MNNLLNQLSIKMKLILLVAFNMLFFIIATGYAIQQMNLIGEELVDIAERDLPLIGVTTKVTEHQITKEVLFERAARYGVLIESEPEAKADLRETIERFKALGTQVAEEILAGEALLEQAIEATSNEEARQKFSLLLGEFISVEKDNLVFDKKAHAVFEMLQKGQIHRSQGTIDEVSELAEKLAHKLEEMLADIELFTEEAALAAEHHEQQAVFILILIVVVVLLLSVGLSIAIINNIRQNLSYGIASMSTIAKGDLTQSIQMIVRMKLALCCSG